MEYEIEEEGALLDASNNPSLDHSAKPMFAAWPKPQTDPREPQRGVAIPEETEPA